MDNKLPQPKQPTRAKPQYSPRAQQQMQLAYKNLASLLAPLFAQKTKVQ